MKLQLGYNNNDSWQFINSEIVAAVANRTSINIEYSLGEIASYKYSVLYMAPTVDGECALRFAGRYDGTDCYFGDGCFFYFDNEVYTELPFSEYELDKSYNLFIEKKVK